MNQKKRYVEIPEWIIFAGCGIFCVGMSMAWVPGGVMSLGLAMVWFGLQLCKDKG